MGKRGLIQRAVDSYRNRNPTMRSRRVARQTKMLNGTLRKRKSIYPVDNNSNGDNASPSCGTTTVTSIPKTMTMEDELHMRFRVKITLDQVDLNDIDLSFRTANSVYPRAMAMNAMASDDQFLQQKWMEENACNELGWKLVSLKKKTLREILLNIFLLLLNRRG